MAPNSKRVSHDQQASAGSSEDKAQTQSVKAKKRKKTSRGK
jgi:hypothetical protein